MDYALYLKGLVNFNDDLGFLSYIARQDLAERDRCDFTRKVGPLKKADDAILIDSTHMTIDEAVEVMVKHIQSKA